MTENFNKNTSDEEIVEYIRNNNKEYYKYILDRYESKLFSYIRRISYNSPEAEDLLQQVFVNVYNNLDKFDPKNKFSSWIYRIAHNITINWLKKKKAGISLDEDETLANTVKDKTNIEEEILQKETKKSLNDAIDNLPEKFKAPFVLKYFENKSYDEIAEILNIPKNTVGTFINRAKKLLKIKCKNKYCNNPEVS